MPERSSYLATASALLGALAGALALLGAGLASKAVITPITGFQSFGLGLLLGFVTLLLGLLGLWRTRSGSGRGGRGRAWSGTALGGSLTVLLLVLAVPSRDVPPINDITTSPEDPPPFVAAALHLENQGRDLSYPADAFAALQREAYPDLGPVSLDQSPEKIYADALAVVDELGWTLVTSERETHIIEAYDVSSLFRFVDDVVIRVRPSRSGSLVDVRSKSRDGRSDLGANATRIRTFVTALTSR